MKTISIKEKFKSMNFKEKCAYIWDYYKIHIISVIVSIILIFSFIHSIVTKADVYCNITYIGETISSEEVAEVKSDLNKNILNNSKKEIIGFDSISTTDMDPVTIQLLAAKISSKEIDLAVVSKDYYEQNVNEFLFFDLSSIKGFSSLNLSDSQLIKAKDEKGNEVVYGIKANNLNYLNKINYSSDDNILVIISNSERVDSAFKLLSLFCETN